jgi:anti-sigma B factor antagonist
MTMSGPVPVVAYLAASGDLSELAPAQLAGAAKALIDDGSVHLVADLSAVEFIGSSGLGALVAIRREALAAGGSFRLRDPSRRVLRLLELTGMSQVFDIQWSLVADQT